MLYNYEIQNAFYRLKTKGIKFFSIGTTSLSKNILCTHLGNYDGPQILIVGATHAREYVTTLLVCKMIEFYNHAKFDGGIYFVPMLNPDGVDICINGTKNIQDLAIRENIENVVSDIKMFKANSNLVDLNVNFPAKWGEGKLNVFAPASENFVGYSAASERETRAIMQLVGLTRPSCVISYHSKGEEIYYNFGDDEKTLKRGLALAKLAKKCTGYKIKKLKGSVGGFKDWCIEKYKIPALTIEVGANKKVHPLSKKDLPAIFKQNFKLPLYMFEKLAKCDKI